MAVGGTLNLDRSNAEEPRKRNRRRQMVRLDGQGLPNSQPTKRLQPGVEQWRQRRDRWAKR